MYRVLDSCFISLDSCVVVFFSWKFGQNCNNGTHTFLGNLAGLLLFGESDLWTPFFVQNPSENTGKVF